MGMEKRYSSKHSNDPFCESYHHSTRRQQQHQCTEPNNDVVLEHTCAQEDHSPKLASSTSQNVPPVLPAFVALLLLVTSITPTALCHTLQGNHTFRPVHELLKLKRVRAHLNKINKHPIKTIQACTTCSFFKPVVNDS